MAIGSAVIPIGSRNAHMVYLFIGSQSTQIAIDRVAADLIVYFADILIYLFGTRMVAVRLHGFQNYLPLLCFPVPLRRAAVTSVQNRELRACIWGKYSHPEACCLRRHTRISCI